MKRVILFLIMCAAIAACFLTPFNVLNAIENKENFASALQEYEDARRSATDMNTSLAQAKTVFDSSRTFDVAYNDITRIVEVLRNTASITVSSVNTASPEKYFATGGAWSSDVEADAVIISITTDDSAAALRVIDKLQLPLYEIVVTEPNIIDIVFLTGGGTR